MTQNKIALVTGGSRGLGRNAAIKIAQKGIDVVITYFSNEEKANEVVDEIRKLGRKSVAIKIDTSNTKEFRSFVTEFTSYLTREYGAAKFDFLINNAGTGGNKAFADAREDEFDAFVNIHYKGVYFLTQKLLPYLNDGGSIVNISSGLARFSHPNTSMYASVKGAIEVVTRIWAVEFGQRGIKVNVVAPGAVGTDFNGGVVRDNEKISEMISGITALGRAGVPDDIGGVIAFLCTEDARWINGQRIEVSGGMHL
ncbi:short-chain dehydrogenase [Elizabethkingia meningoseptica]|uniref:SDR family NAD(P)-dependent oxidoreductase n=1 Tax=Elizabethkingia meningoseptica TaxID=238 RepID=UPI0008414063|nr:SDR family oxidoreductase [Elizabethkingia meningoseptica]ODM55153.1 short-chain dehydrogenase [Elizabethkingia meningoseptica]OHT30359.1 short-chain dehydrogenase [Elizabethkingia meningoseptica]OPC12094.1 short-chain dehydrogenase [Elizabethkingia meningoseptica]OPC20517.1 short-chain dehydrogenase [Elizabethkingia meningoseptica]